MKILSKSILNKINKIITIDDFFLVSDSCWTYFLRTCVNNLHVILSMLPGDELRTRCRNFPGLINKTYINWIFPWPEQALYAVAKTFIDEVNNIFL
jgi:dynein heavy chain